MVLYLSHIVKRKYKSVPHRCSLVWAVEHFCVCSSIWCSIKDDYRTLAELEGVNVVNLYTDINDEDEDHEWSAFLSAIRQVLNAKMQAVKRQYIRRPKDKFSCFSLQVFPFIFFHARFPLKRKQQPLAGSLLRWSPDLQLCSKLLLKETQITRTDF